MKKLLTVLLILLPTVAGAKLKVITTIPDLAALTREVGGDLVEVESLCRGDQDPHYLEPKPSFAVKINRADLLIEVGLELESGWLPVLLTQARNPKIQPGQPGHLDASEGFPILEIPTGPNVKIDRSQGDIHPSGNPHYWMRPANGLVIAQRIASKLEDLDPPNAEAYRQNFNQWTKRLNAAITRWEEAIRPLRGRRVIAHHKSFSYFVDWTGLTVADLIEPKPGIPPSPSHILNLIETIRREKIPLIITENYYDPAPSRELAHRTGARVLVLPTSVGGEKGIDTTLDLFETLILRLRGTL